nr:hypothetical protein [Tanacetum cinerariifolium]
MGHFARECRNPRSQENRLRNQDSSRKTVIVEDTSSKAMVAIEGEGFDWNCMADDEVPTNMALMAFSDLEVSDYDEDESEEMVLKFENVQHKPEQVNQPRKGDPQAALRDTRIFDSGCSRHMTGNKSFLSDYQEYDRGFVAFVSSSKGVSAGNRTNGIAGSKIHSDVGQEGKEKLSDQEYILLPVVNTSSDVPSSNKEVVSSPKDDAGKKSTVEPTCVEGGQIDDLGFNIVGSSFSHPAALDDFPKMPNLEDTGIFDDAYDDRDEGAEADYNNLEIIIPISPIPSTIIHKDHPKEQNIREVNSVVQTRKMAKENEARLITFINKQRRTNDKDFQNCLFACFLSQMEPKKMPNLEDTRIFDDAYDDRDEGAEADYNNLEIIIPISPIPSTIIHKDHPKEQNIREVNSAVQTRKMAKENEA